MAVSEKLSLLISLDAAGAIKGFEKVGDTAEKELSKAQQRIDKISGNMVKFGAAGLAATGVAAVGLAKFAKAADEANFAQLQLENSLQNMPKLAGQNSKQFTQLATAIQSKTAADADQIVSAQAMLGTFNTTADEIKKITPLVVDYSRKFGVDLTSASIQVGKALDGNVTALKKNGVSIDETLFKTDRFRAVQEALANQVGGFAEAEGKTFSGSLQRIKNQLGDVAEGIGTGVIPVFEKITEPLGRVATAFGEADPKVQAFVGSIATIGVGAAGAVSAMSFVGGQAIKMKEKFTVAEGATGVFGTSLSKTGAAAIGIGAALGIGAGVISYFAQKSAEAKARTLELSDAIGQLGAAGAAEKELTKLFDTVGELQRLKTANTSIKELADSYQEFGQSVAATYVPAAVALAQQGQVGRQFDEIREKIDSSTNAYDQQITKIGRAGQANIDFVTDIQNTGKELLKSKDFQEQQTIALQKSTRAVEISIEAEKERQQQLKETADAIQGAIRADIAYAQATRDTTKKLDEYNAAVKKNGVNSEQAQIASEEYRLAVLGQADALVKLREEESKKAGVELTAIERTREQIRVYQDQANALAPGSQLRVQIEGYIGALKTIPGVVETEIRTKLDPASWAATKAQLQKAFGPNKALANYELNTGYRRASGGPLFGGQTALVGENGAELITLGRNQTANVTPLSKLPSGSSAGVAQNVYNINVATGIGDPNAIARAVKDSLTRFDRRSA